MRAILDKMIEIRGVFAYLTEMWCLQSTFLSNFAFHMFCSRIMIKEKFISAIIGTLFFAVFQPFGLSLFCMSERILITCGLLIVAFVSCMTCEGIVNYVLRMPMDTSKGPSFTMKRGIVFQVCNIIVLTIYLSLFFDRFVNNDVVDNHLSVNNCLAILIASIGSCFFIGLYWRNVYWKRHYAKQLEEAQILNGVLMERARQVEVSGQALMSDASSAKEEQVMLEGSTKESVSLLPSDFLFAESEGNYVSIHYMDHSAEKQTMLRTSMKNVVVILCANNEIMQCHRAYIVNLRHVESVEGRSSGIGLKLRHSDTVVPVSKSYVNDVKERIKNPL